MREQVVFLYLPPPMHGEGNSDANPPHWSHCTVRLRRTCGERRLRQVLAVEKPLFSGGCCLCAGVSDSSKFPAPKRRLFTRPT